MEEYTMKTPSIVITKEVQEEIIHSLREINFPANLKGYNHMKTALEAILNRPELIEYITKELYPIVAEAHQTTPSRVERALRHSIEVVYDRNDPEYLAEVLGPSNYNKGKLTNSEFLAVMAENIRISLDRITELKKEVLPQACKNVADEARLEQLRQDLITLGILTPCTQKGTQA